MDEFEFDYDEGSDIDNWEDEQVFQDDALERQACEDWEDDLDDVDWEAEREQAFQDDENKRIREDGPVFDSDTGIDFGYDD